MKSTILLEIDGNDIILTDNEIDGPVIGMIRMPALTALQVAEYLINNALTIIDDISGPDEEELDAPAKDG